MTYLVTGATGTIGSAVTRCLLARGHRPSVFVHDARKARALFGERVDGSSSTSMRFADRSPSHGARR